MYEETTIAAIATSPGEGGIGIVRISGIRATDIGNTLFRAKKSKISKTPNRTACISATS